MAKVSARGLQFWNFTVFVLIVGFLLVVKDTWLEQGLEQERQGIYELLGPAKAEATEVRVHNRYTRWFVETGIIEKSFMLVSPPQQEGTQIEEIDQKINPVFIWMEGRLRAFWLVVFQVMYRLAVTLMWWPFFVLTAVPFIVDALVRRKIKANTFDHTSPTLQALGVRAVALLVIAYPFMLLAPFALPPQLMPIMIFLSAAAVWFSVSHFVKRA